MSAPTLASRQKRSHDGLPDCVGDFSPADRFTVGATTDGRGWAWLWWQTVLPRHGWAGPSPVGSILFRQEFGSVSSWRRWLRNIACLDSERDSPAWRRDINRAAGEAFCLPPAIALRSSARSANRAEPDHLARCCEILVGFHFRISATLAIGDLISVIDRVESTARDTGLRAAWLAGFNPYFWKAAYGGNRNGRAGSSSATEG